MEISFKIVLVRVKQRKLSKLDFMDESGPKNELLKFMSVVY